MDLLRAFLPIDRCHALASGTALPDRVRGAALFADVSGFTALTAALARELGPKRGAEELLTHLNRVYECLVTVIHDGGGAVVGFAGDSITCWFDEAPGGRSGLPAPELRAVTAAHRLHEAMRATPAVVTPAGASVALGIKVAVAAGPARRFAAGDPAHALLDTLAGGTLTRMAAAERVAAVSETVVDDAVRHRLGDGLVTGARRELAPGAGAVWVVDSLREPAPATPWPPLPEAWSAVEARHWVLPAVAERLAAGGGFLGELRPAVPLFVGFEGIDWDGDAEAGALLDRYVRWVQGVLGALGGAVIQLTIGDKGSNIYAVFGAPVAHEDDPDRAAAAALALATVPPELDYVINPRIGMAQGQVWTGACGAAARRCYGVMGEPVNLAARLMMRAGPGEILAEERLVRAAARHRFAPVETATIKGRATPLAFAALEGRRDQPPSRSRGGTGDMVGREAELAAMVPLLEGVLGGAGRTALIEGEAGIGKSRLAAALAARSRAAGLPTLEGAGDSVEQGRAYHAWRPVFAELFRAEDSPDQEALRTHALQRLETLDPELVRRAPLLEAVLRLGIPETPLTAQMDAAVRAENTRDLFVRLLLELPGGPVTLLLEDAHWFDSASWALVAELRRRSAPLFLVLVSRPLEAGSAEGALPAEAGDLLTAPDVLRIRLSALDAADTVALVCRRLGVGSIPPGAARLISERAEGNPLFVEELAQAMVEAGVLLVEAGQCRLADSAEADPAAAFPVTLEGLVTSRLDRLPPPAQRTAKVASVIGRIFPLRTLEAVHPIPEERARIPHTLEELERLDITRTTADRDVTYTFKHAITHEVVYGTLLYAQRRELHRALAEWTERSYGADLAPWYSTLAHHWERAEAPAEALLYGERAGEQALRSHANREAAAFFTRVLARLSSDEGLPPEPAETRRLRRIRALRRLAQATYALGDIPVTAARLREALALLGKPLPESPLRLSGILLGEMLRQAAHRLMPRRAVAPPSDQAERIEGSGALGTMIQTYYFTGNLLGAVAANFRALNLAEGARAGPELALELAAAYTNVGAAFGNAFGFHGVEAGYFARAERVAREANHLPALGYLEQVRGMVAFLSGRLGIAGAPLDRAAAIFDELGDRRRWEESRFSRGAVHIMFGELEAGRAATVDCVASSRRRESTQMVVLGLAQLGHVLFLQGRLAEAVSALDESRGMHAREPYLAERLYATGVLALARAMQDDRTAALDLLDEAAALTRRLPMSNLALDGYAAAAEAALRLCSTDGAERSRALAVATLAHAALARTARLSAGVYRARALRMAGGLLLARGRVRAGQRALRRAAALAARGGLVVDEGLAALALAEAAGAPPERAGYAARARLLLRRAGAAWYLGRLDALSPE